MSKRISWGELRESGILWWINRSLHLFGLAIVVEINKEGNITEAYPVRCKYRGFSRDCEEDGFKKVTNYLQGNIVDLSDEVKDEAIK